MGASMPRFVVLEHHHEGVHWDFMLESGDGLRTWRIAAAPAVGAAIAATPLADHRIAYLEYEGEISGGRGLVSRWDRGGFQWERDGLDDVVVRVAGARIRGRVHLWKSESGVWTFTLTSTASAD
jgi:hypothetical protein